MQHNTQQQGFLSLLHLSHFQQKVVGSALRALLRLLPGRDSEPQLAPTTLVLQVFDGSSVILTEDPDPALHLGDIRGVPQHQHSQVIY